ncbi:hypothetical protein NDN08_003034 [Rhodosorus marinus]|uniref:Uncharacterized protein n=1 Tax=Rhodosorus marinus TaxID=101924 RepID=A0AAV8UY62_9RHOD|nr:hypothetical protein NDN08_003034 [Rhodosorus marinus]
MGSRRPQYSMPDDSGAGLIGLFRRLPPAVKLALSILVDLVGCFTYLFPAVGEVADVWWAPLSASIIYAMYGSVFYAVLGFAEEMLPGTDLIPTASLAWMYDYYKRRRRLARDPNSGAM